MFNVIRTRKGRLEHKLLEVHSFDEKDVRQLISIFNDFEKDNINTIEKLRRGKRIELNKINGALRQTINAHGPITMELIGSASKRIHGALLDNTKADKIPKDVKIAWTIFILIGIFCWSLIWLFNW